MGGNTSGSPGLMYCHHPFEMLATMTIATQATKARIVLSDEVVGYDIATTHVRRTCARSIRDAAKSTATPPPLTTVGVSTQELLHLSAVARPRRQAHRSADRLPHRLVQHHKFVGRVVAHNHIWLNAESCSRTWLNGGWWSLRCPEGVGPRIASLRRARWGLLTTG